MVKLSDRWHNPVDQDIWAKIIWVHDALALQDPDKMPSHRRNMLEQCKRRLEQVEGILSPSWKVFPWFPLLKKNYTLVWQLLHLIDEDMILFISPQELINRAREVQTYFDMNIKEEKIRLEWFGRQGEAEKGRFCEAINAIEACLKGGCIAADDQELEQQRHTIKDALHLVNQQMDKTYWHLSLNTLMSVQSALLLVLVMTIFWWGRFTDSIDHLGSGNFTGNVLPILLLGLMGAYLSNLVTTEKFLFVSDSFYRYLLHPSFAKPVMSAFAALVFFLIEKSHLIFAIVPSEQSGTAPLSIIMIKVSTTQIGYVYALLAIIAGFSGDKLLRSMFDRVLAKIEAKAEKNRETKD